MLRAPGVMTWGRPCFLQLAIVPRETCKRLQTSSVAMNPSASPGGGCAARNSRRAWGVLSSTTSASTTAFVSGAVTSLFFTALIKRRCAKIKTDSLILACPHFGGTAGRGQRQFYPGTEFLEVAPVGGPGIFILAHATGEAGFSVGQDGSLRDVFADLL